MGVSPFVTPTRAGQKKSLDVVQGFASTRVSIAAAVQQGTLSTVARTRAFRKRRGEPV